MSPPASQMETLECSRVKEVPNTQGSLEKRNDCNKRGFLGLAHMTDSI